MLATLDPGHYRRVTYADGSEGVEEPGEVLGYFDAKGIKLPLDQDRKVRADNLTELEMARVFAKAGTPAPTTNRWAARPRSSGPGSRRHSASPTPSTGPSRSVTPSRNFVLLTPRSGSAWSPRATARPTAGT